jgi:hypothetical protein
LARRLGRIGAILAVSVQLLLPAVAMPGHDFDRFPTAPILQQAVAIWGQDALCTTRTADDQKGSKQVPASHRQCPICWALWHTASLPAPAGAALLLPPPLVEARHSPVSIASGLHPTYSPSQPRAPPSA